MDEKEAILKSLEDDMKNLEKRVSVYYAEDALFWDKMASHNKYMRYFLMYFVLPLNFLSLIFNAIGHQYFWAFVAALVLGYFSTQPKKLKKEIARDKLRSKASYALYLKQVERK